MTRQVTLLALTLAVLMTTAMSPAAAVAQEDVAGEDEEPELVWAPLETPPPLVVPPEFTPTDLADGFSLGAADAPVVVEVWSGLTLDGLGVAAALSAAVAYAVRRSCEIKAQVVSVDEREQGVRAILNLGHTFGHAIETASGYGSWLHGEAVATGMVMAVDMSEKLGLLKATERARAVQLLERLRLPVKAPRIGAERARELMGMDKKVIGGRIRLILLRQLGQAEVVSEEVQPDA